MVGKSNEKKKRCNWLGTQRWKNYLTRIGGRVRFPPVALAGLIVAWLKRWDDDSDDKDMKAYSMSTSATPVTAGMAEEKGKEPEKK
jgi:hypothetical protein